MTGGSKTHRAHPRFGRGQTTLNRLSRLALVPLFLLPLVALQLRVGAAEEEKPQNPHGELEEACSVCHSATAWRPAVVSDAFDHAKHGMTLISAHARADCMSCHRTLVFDTENPECVSCHQDVHQAELRTDCERCHTVTSFIDRAQMRREHQFTRFPLRGSHAVVDCDRCHTPVDQGQMVYVNRDTECVSCHRDEYRAATNPDHLAVGFPEDCKLCHLAVSWDHARTNTDVLNHDGQFFPIFSGKHRNKWDTCDECHVSRSDFSTFSCILCHKHADEAQTSGQHDGVPGFRYATADCFACHPQGSV